VAHYPGQKKSRSDCPGQVNFPFVKVKTEVQWPCGQVKFSVISLNENVSLIHVNDNFQSKAISKLKTARLVNH